VNIKLKSILFWLPGIGRYGGTPLSAQTKREQLFPPTNFRAAVNDTAALCPFGCNINNWRQTAF